MSKKIAVSALLDKLKTAKIEIAETRTLHDGTKVYLLVGTLPVFPTGAKPTWYPLVVRKGEATIEVKEAEAILRHFWNMQIKFFPKYRHQTL